MRYWARPLSYLHMRVSTPNGGSLFEYKISHDRFLV